MSPNQKNILIIEDEQFIAEIYSRELTKAGFLVNIAPDGLVGLQMLQSQSFDLLLLDIMLPGMHGLELLKHWKSKFPDSKMPILLLTNLGQEEVIKEAFSFGATGYFIKASYTPQQIVAEVQNVLSGKVSAPATAQPSA